MMKINQNSTQVCEVSQDLLKLFLEPYKEDCKYLKEAQFYRENSSQDSRKLGFIKGQFSIPNSCYIDDTGHFNSVEFNICYNQLFYVFIAHAIENQLLKVMNDWDLESYKYRQLSDFLIVKFSSAFKKPIDPRNFQGTLSINKCTARGNLIMMKTSCNFYDNNEGWAEGDITIAILNGESQKAANHQLNTVFA